MASVKYEYIKDVNVTVLGETIRESTIVTALDYISTLGSTCDIYMKAALSATDQTTLNTIVTDHTDTPDIPETGKYTLDQKQWIQESSRPLGTVTYFTSEGDTTSDSTVMSTAVGGGTKIQITHTAGSDASDQELYVDFNVKENDTYIHEGYVIWKEADFDRVNLEVVPQVTEYTADSSTLFQTYGPYIIPAAYTGNINVATDTTAMKLVEMPLSRDTGLRKPGYWKADYNEETHTFSNLTAAPDGDGIYNMFCAEVVLSRFVNEIILVNDGFLMLQTADVEQLGHGMRLKLHAHTNTDETDHSWKAGFILTLNRENTC